MSADIGPGTLVEVVRDTAFNGHGYTVTKGTVDRVEEVVDIGGQWMCWRCDTILQEAVRLSRMPKHFALCLCAVRPISGGEPGMFHDLLKVPTKEREPA